MCTVYYIYYKICNICPGMYNYISDEIRWYGTSVDSGSATMPHIYGNRFPCPADEQRPWSTELAYHMAVVPRNEKLDQPGKNTTLKTPTSNGLQPTSDGLQPNV